MGGLGGHPQKIFEFKHIKVQLERLPKNYENDEIKHFLSAGIVRKVENYDMYWIYTMVLAKLKEKTGLKQCKH